MGVEYAVICDDTMQAIHLGGQGRKPWTDLVICRSDRVRDLLIKILEIYQLDMNYDRALNLAVAIFSLNTGGDCRVISDGGDKWWQTKDDWDKEGGPCGEDEYMQIYAREGSEL